MKLTDTHCHLDYDWFDEDREEVIARAVSSGVEKMVIPGIDLASCRKGLKIAETHPEVYAAVGIHPNSGMSWDAGTLKELRSLAQHPKVVAIGEIGLDYHWDKTPPKRQEKVFREQLELAAEAGLPVIIHNREATEDVLRMLVDWQKDLSKEGHRLAEEPGVLHSYSGTIEQAATALQAKYYLGITGPVTFKKADELRRVVAGLPEGRILVETDAPFLTPTPHRGKRNEPAYVDYVVEKIAAVRNVSPSEIRKATNKNATKLFKW